MASARGGAAVPVQPPAPHTEDGSATTDAKMTSFDPRRFRPFKVTVAITMHDLRAHLMKVSMLSGSVEIMHRFLVLIVPNSLHSYTTRTPRSDFKRFYPSPQ